MRAQDPRVPPEVEEYLIGIFAAAGQLGGEIGGAIGGGVRGRRGGRRGGARGGARGARLLRTTVEERVGVRPGDPAQLRRRLAASFPHAATLSEQGGRWRVDLPVGRMRLQHVIVDLSLTPAPDGTATEVTLRAYCKQGLAHRGLTTRIANELWEALAG